MRKEGIVGIGVGAFAVVCCAGLPVLVALVGGTAVAIALGLTVGAAAVVGLLALAWARRAPRGRR